MTAPLPSTAPVAAHAAPSPAPIASTASDSTAFKVLGAISVAHLMNDMIQSILLAIYPMLKDTFSLSFGQIGMITLTYQIAASLLQPCVGLYTDKRPLPYSLPVGMGFTLVGLLLLSVAPSYPVLLVAAVLVGTGSSVFHPESSRVARMASGGRHGLAQSLFQVGGNVGSALGPLLAALVIIPHGQGSVAWFSLAALFGMVVLIGIGRWYGANRWRLKPKARAAGGAAPLSRARVAATLGVLAVLIFSKYFYLASLNSYFTFYLMDKFDLPVRSAQLYLFIFLAAVAVGTVVGGPVGDRVGRKAVIWTSILGVTPFTLLLPYANLFWTGVLVAVIGIVLASAFAAIVVYAQELVPGKVGTIAGLFFGFAFGMGGVGAAVLGHIADATSITYVYKLCSFLPLLGMMAVFLPDMGRRKA
jgi:FSR family fosmidomycin resistance protein-like MFS transporter